MGFMSNVLLVWLRGSKGDSKARFCWRVGVNISKISKAPFTGDFYWYSSSFLGSK